jgi:hypothetical protein
MIVPLHLLPEGAHTVPALPDFGTNLGVMVESLDLGMPVAGAVSLLELMELQTLLQAEGQSLQPTRMLYDRLYALERLAAAHASANPQLRERALRLFDRYQQAGEWIGLVH